MKKIVFFVVKKELDLAIQNYFANDFRNSVLYEKSRKFYFYSKINNSEEEIDVFIQILNFDEELINVLKEILNNSYKIALKISDEPIEELPKNSSIYSEIVTTVNKYSYIECESVFYFVSELFYKYIMGHYLKNGNKRLSLCFLISILWFFGYYLKWTKGDLIDYNKYKSQLEIWVQEFQNNSKEIDIIKNIKKIEMWIKKNIVIALNWRASHD